MPTLSSYLNFDGNAEEAFNFYKSVFGGEFVTLQYIKDMPNGAADNFPENERNRVMHVSLPIGDSILMASDILPSVGHTLRIGNNCHISISPKSEAEAEKFFKALSEGGTIVMPLEKMFWGSLFGNCVDKFGVQWMVNYDLNKKA